MAARTQQAVVLVAPVGVVREGDVHKAWVAVVAEYRRRQRGAAVLLPQHAGEVRGLYDGVQVGHLQDAACRSDSATAGALQTTEHSMRPWAIAQKWVTWQALTCPGWCRKVSMSARMAYGILPLAARLPAAVRHAQIQ